MRRGLGQHRRSRGSWPRFLSLSALPVLLILAIFWYISAVTTFLHRNQAVDAETIGVALPCVAWRATRSCSPYGQRDTAGDRDCQAWITRTSGYCECAGFLTTKRMECAHFMPFTCERACALLSNDMSEAIQLPRNVSCPPRGTREHTLLGTAAQWLHGGGGGGGLSAGALANIRDMDAGAVHMWKLIRAALDIVGSDAIMLPEDRTVNVDWVRDGVRLPKEDVQAAREQWQAFMRETPPYPRRSYRGRGIVILAGGLTYMVPAWVNIHMLRRTGCTLPVEMFFPKREYPTPSLEAALAELGVVCRHLPDLRPEVAQQADPEQHVEHPLQSPALSGFTMKIAALILSQFREVIFLDSDNVAVADPSSLFSSEEYQRTGAVLWPDYWKSSAADDLAKILDVQALPEGTFESGQMVFDKERAWGGLLLAAYFNMQSKLYYELFSNFMGKGDKESFAHALRAMRIPFSVVPQPVGSLGEVRRQCNGRGACAPEFLGNTMTQYAPDGRLMFLHTNLSPKWSLEIPGDFKEYRRRWRTIMPGKVDLIEKLGDLEAEVYRILVGLHCADFLPSYVEVLGRADRMGEGNTLPTGLHGFHALNPGVDFRQAYRWGLSGPYLSFTQVTLHDRLSYFVNTAVKSCWGYFRRILRSILSKLPGRKDAYFTLW